MDRILDQFIVVLRRTEALYTRLLPTIQSEKEAAVASNIEGFIHFSAAKQDQLIEIRQLDRVRESLQRQIGASLDKPAQSLTLSCLATMVGAPYNQQLRQIQSVLTETIEKVRRANDESRLLVAHCLKLVGNTLSFFKHWNSAADVYGANGDLRQGAGNGRLLSGSV